MWIYMRNLLAGKCNMCEQNMNRQVRDDGFENKLFDSIQWAVLAETPSRRTDADSPQRISNLKFGEQLFLARFRWQVM